MAVSSHVSPAAGALTWRPTKIMNMRDLSKDDDFLSHLLVEKLGTGTVPLLVHKMDSSRRLPKTDAQQLMQIVRRVCPASLCLFFRDSFAIYAIPTFSLHLAARHHQRSGSPGRSPGCRRIAHVCGALTYRASRGSPSYTLA